MKNAETGSSLKWYIYRFIEAGQVGNTYFACHTEEFDKRLGEINELSESMGWSMLSIAEVDEEPIDLDLLNNESGENERIHFVDRSGAVTRFFSVFFMGMLGLSVA